MPVNCDAEYGVARRSTPQRRRFHKRNARITTFDQTLIAEGSNFDRQSWWNWLLLVLVSLLSTLGLGLSFLLVAVVHDEFVGRHLGQDKRSMKKECSLLTAIFLVLAAAAIFLPPWIALATMLAPNRVRKPSPLLPIAT